MEKKMHNKLVRDKVPNKISDNGEFYEIRRLTDEELEEETNRKLLEELNEVLSANSSNELLGELADLVQVILLKAEINNISFGDIERARLQKIEKNGDFKERIFLISTEDKEYVDSNRGCLSCDNKDCLLPISENIDFEDDGKPAGYYCVDYICKYKRGVK